MDLFNTLPPNEINILPRDGEVYYYGHIFNLKTTDDYLQKLLQSIEWKNDEAIIFGKRIVTKRKVAWYGDKPFKYTYSKTTKSALLWTPGLLQLKKSVEKITNETYNSCLLNLYHDGSEGMAWHSDAEKDLKQNGAIASLSFGATRKFSFKHKNTKEKVNIILENGSLLVMKGETQKNWLHRLPPTKKVLTPRVNLTFRTIVE
ncbi:alpha-ketoglutarate-dependent dioxygenase AlkB [Galbibacter sp. BG1]|uniref:alpha-ketoglutarate-dependent dioxygenase AlkB family protein n=1 Tax=Galbibacter sp. BG1 TaxID=1170699 RepID=UPI0015C07C6A|nr:alpha-ketoglutarate-dependent dioxygenase AlkB [Galbibacter sp. BG1]QLE02998.1 alpha-ketoglutarate-dependent dioxygenase AlkB [Galbibacter sp. BG1]